VRVLIVDDEPAARRRLAALLEELDVEVAGEAADGPAALDRIRAERPDVVLLDIAMPEVDGFEVARHLPEPKPLVIFQTAFDAFAVKAFEHEALDYVLKPVTRQRLEQALERARRRLAEARSALTPAAIARLEAAVAQGRAPRPTRLLVRHQAGYRALPLREVLVFRADEGLVYAHTARSPYLTDYTLNELEARTAGSFVRVNRAELVNLDRIDRFVPSGDGSATVTLADGTTVHVSRRRMSDVKQALQG
jgi:DNA-binding LytR/AlgR family response regulator